jgi:hypothetical protein
MKQFENQLLEKSATVDGHKLFALCCGEVHVLATGKTEPHKVNVCTFVEKALREATIVVNPTHDMMKQRLRPKREYLSKGNRVYISVSNWNSSRSQGKLPNTEKLHTVYWNGKLQPYKRMNEPLSTDARQYYEYREWEVPL